MNDDLRPVLGNGYSYYPKAEWTEVPELTREDIWWDIKRDFPHATRSYIKEQYGIDMGLPKHSTVQQLQQLYSTLQARQLNGLLLK